MQGGDDWTSTGCAEKASEAFGGLLIKIDVSQKASVIGGMQAIADQFGTIDSCNANAGIGGGQNIHNSSFEFWRRVMSVNVYGAYLTIREAMRHMPVTEWCRVIAISSIAGMRGLKGAHAYNASKHGVIGMVWALSCDHTKMPITFNAICPGYVDTDIITQNRYSIASRT